MLIQQVVTLGDQRLQLNTFSHLTVRGGAEVGTPATVSRIPGLRLSRQLFATT